MRKFILSSLLATLTVILFICITCSLIITACRKVEEKDTVGENTLAARSKFFTVPVTTNSIVKAIAQSIKRQDQQRDFVPSLSKKAGYPVWNKAIITKTSIANVTARLPGDSGEVVLIPFVKENEYITNAILIVNTGTTSRDTTYKLLYASRYEDFEFDYSDTTKAGAKNIFHLFMVFDNEIFGYTKFMVKDSRILTGDPKDTTEETMVTLLNGHGTSYENRLVYITFCNDIEICDKCGFRVSNRNTVEGCRCGSHVETICTTVSTEVGYPGGGSGGHSGGGVISGGGGDENWEDENPCRVIPSIGTNPCTGNGGNNGQSGWIPIIDEDDELQNPVDSMKIKQIYLSIQDSANHYYTKSNIDSAEWCFTLTKNNGVFNRKSKTDADPDAVTPNLNVPTGDTLIGFWHAHQGNVSYLNLNLCFSSADYWYMYQKLRFDNAIAFATTKDFVYAMVITNAQKFKTYLDHGNTRLVENFLTNQYSLGENSCTSGCTTNRLSELANIMIAANESTTGIKIYKSNRNNINFSTLN
jgi:hypothetical protein